MLLNCGVGEDSWESLGVRADQTSLTQRKSTLNIQWKDWCWNWSSNTLAMWCEELTHWKRPWWWERLKVEGEGANWGWDGWMASLTRWIEFEETPGVGDGQGRVVCCSPWDCKELDRTEQLYWLKYKEEIGKAKSLADYCDERWSKCIYFMYLIFP